MKWINEEIMLETSQRAIQRRHSLLAAFRTSLLNLSLDSETVTGKCFHKEKES